ncbi:MAG: NADH-quinone oxidoreductase subunit NuoH, partial [SAR202 cluster bacterium]|nr:NADH-quinone oxidoreductase subunit NuoH [SAR202 cluster bacterium]
MAWLALLLTGLVLAFAFINALMIFVAGVVFIERRVLGRFQSRLGPNRVGPFGALQPIADLVKLVFKEDVVPAQADKLVFFLAPVMMVVPALALTAVIPYGKNTYIANLNVGILFAVAITSVSSLGIFMAGWGSSNRFATLGAMRGVAMLVSYEVPMILSLAGVLLMSGTLSLVGVVEAQRIPFVLLQPLGFLVFLIAATAEMNRAPFDIIEADSEIVAGYHTEYSGIKWGMFQLAEYAAMTVSAAVLVTVFLGGWQNPFVPQSWAQVLPSQLWFLLKLGFVLFLLIWVRATIPRMRVDQILGFAWKVLFPLAFLNLVVTAIEVQIVPYPSAWQLWLLVGINMAVAAGAVVGFGAALR